MEEKLYVGYDFKGIMRYFHQLAKFKFEKKQTFRISYLSEDRAEERGQKYRCWY